MTTNRYSPTIRRRRLAAELRRLREERGLTIEQVAQQIDWHPTKLSRVETGKQAVQPSEVRGLLDVLGARDAAQSRRLSDASFAVLFALARELVAARVSFVLEGNFRPGEHESPLRTVLERGAPAVSAAQILCRVTEPVRLERLAARVGDPSRHPGHRDAELRTAGDRRSDAFLDLPAERFLYDGSGRDPGASERLTLLLDAWWRGP